MTNNIFLELKAIKVDQPLASFYITKIKARDLLNIAFSEELQYTDRGSLVGSQRVLDDKRLKQIARFIDSVEMCFPSSIILAANYNEDGKIVEDEEIRWQLSSESDSVFLIRIPRNIKLAAIIDGQHRLKAFEYVTKSESADIEVPCSIFFDLPNSYQAYIFATVNGNQKKVDKSLSLEQFGFNVEDEPSKSWTPEKFAVYLTRRLNFTKSSPLYNHIKLAPLSMNLPIEINQSETWLISTATVVDGILALISNNPKRDRVEMAQKHIFSGRSRSQIKNIADKSPLRRYFIENEDEKIFNIIVNFLRSLEVNLWRQQKSNSYLLKTIGIQAQFDWLKTILLANQERDDIAFDMFVNNLTYVDFSDNYFQASGVGRSRMKNLFLYASDLMDPSNLKPSDLEAFMRLLGR